MIMTLEDFHKQHEEQYIFLSDDDFREGNAFLQDVWNHLRKYRQISENQIKGINNTMNYMAKKDSQDAEREANKDVEASGNYVGIIKTRYDMTLKLVSTKRTQRGFYIKTFEDRAGNTLIQFDFSTGHVRADDNEPVPVGGCLTCRATIKRHTVNDFNPSNKIKQTIINRVKYKKYLGAKDD